MLLLCVAADASLRSVVSSLGAAGLGAIEVVETTGQAITRAALGGVSLVIFDPNTIQGLTQDELMTLLGSFGGAQTALLGDVRRGTEVLTFLRQGEANHVLGCTWGEAGSPAFEPGAFFETMRKLATREAFGVADYLGSGVQITEARVPDYAAKVAAVRAIGGYAESLGCRRQQVARVEAVADELLLNGLYDAPGLRLGRNLFAERERAGVSPAILRYGCNGTYFVVGVTDVYGELTRSSLIDHLELAASGARMPRPPQESQTGGAGLGLHVVLDAVTHLVARVEPKQETEVIGIFDLRLSTRTARNTSPSVSVSFTDGLRKGADPCLSS
jgi:hypothetical protein